MYLNTSAVYAIRLTQPNSLKNFPSKITSFMKKKAMLARPCTFRACFPKTYYLRQWRRRSNNKHKNVHFYRMENYGVEGNILAYSHYLVADEKLQEILFWKKWEKDQILYAGFLYYVGIHITRASATTQPHSKISKSKEGCCSLSWSFMKFHASKSRYVWAYMVMKKYFTF